MIRFKNLVVALALLASFVSAEAGRKGPWSKEKAWEWYEKQPWMRGCNYMSADCCNRVDVWQKLGFEERFETQKKELALAQSIGFNTMRIIIAEGGFGIWIADHKGFMKRFERTLALLDHYGMRAIIVLGNDCSRPKQLWELPKPGKQTYDVGYHGGRKLSQHGTFPDATGYTVLDHPKYGPKFYEMCKEIITKYKDDNRIVVWNLLNEPGANKRGTISVPHLRHLFELAWEIDPIQPLTADLWNTRGADDRNPTEVVAGELSDIISYHCYAPLAKQIAIAKDLKERYGRPMINTEWMARILGDEIADNYAFFQQNHIGCTMWGFVAGKYQTYEPWESMWKDIEQGRGKHYRMTKWFHDLYRPSLRPYDPVEEDIIKRVNAQADQEMEKANGGSLRQKIGASCKILGEDMWNGFRRTKFEFEGHVAWVVEPSVTPAKGNPWTWTMQWAEAFVDRTGVPDLLRKGYHHVTLEAYDTRACDASLPMFASFQRFLTETLGLAAKANLIGMSWGGFYSVRYAATYPDNVRKIYLDAPLLNFTDFGANTEERLGPWAHSIPEEGKWSSDPRMPLNMAEKLADAHIPLLLLYGGCDQTVLPAQNCEPFLKRFQGAGGEAQVIKRDSYAHHPYGMDLNKTSIITNFIEKD